MLALEIGDRHRECLRTALPIAELDPAARDVVIGDGTPAVLPAPDLDRHLLGHGAEPDLAAAALILRRRNGHYELVAADRDRHRQCCCAPAAECDRALNRALVIAEHML